MRIIYAGSLGIPSILLERGHSSQWCQSLVDEDVHDVKNILRYLGVFKGQAHRHEKTPIDVSPAIYEDAPVEGCWYPTRQPGETFREGDVLGYIKDYFGNELFRCIARQDGHHSLRNHQPLHYERQPDGGLWNLGFYETWGSGEEAALSAEKQNIRDIIIIKNQRLMEPREASAQLMGEPYVVPLK